MTGAEESSCRRTLSSPSESKRFDSVSRGQVVSRRHLSASVAPWAAVLILVGSALQGCANGTIDAIPVALLYWLLGYVGVRSIFSNAQAERRAFLLTYAICIFTGGLVQCYSIWAFGKPQSTVDAIGFFDAILPQPPYYTWENLSSLWTGEGPVGRGAPLAVAIWQYAYHFRWLLGLSFGPYVGVMLNALVMGLAAAITVRTARELFEADEWRLRRVGTLFAFCGLFMLFGSILIRDCFTTFFNALVLWGIVHWLSRPSMKSLLWALLLTGISIGAMTYLRSRSVPLFGFFWFLAIVCWFMSKRLNATRLCVVLLGSMILVLLSTYLLSFLQTTRMLQSSNQDAYAEKLAETSQEDSMAMRFLVQQPLPVRLVLGTGSRMVFPIPLWAYFRAQASEYHLFKGYHGLFQALVMPMFLAGFLAIPSIYRRERRAAMPIVFLGLYLLMNVEAVMATSLEQRHIAQFMPAFFIIAAIPDTRDKKTLNTVQALAAGWLAVVVTAHLAWFILKYHS